jgi:hypothetical protein
VMVSNGSDGGISGKTVDWFEGVSERGWTRRESTGGEGAATALCAPLSLGRSGILGQWHLRLGWE